MITVGTELEIQRISDGFKFDAKKLIADLFSNRLSDMKHARFEDLSTSKTHRSRFVNLKFGGNLLLICTPVKLRRDRVPVRRMALG